MTETVKDTFSKLLQAAKDRQAESGNADGIEIHIGNATCENAAGALDVHREFTRCLSTSGRKDIILRRTGCTGRCSCEPIVSVSMPGKRTVKYEKVDVERAHRIFTSHILGSEPIEEYILDASADSRPRKILFICGGARCGWKGDGAGLADTMEQLLKDAGVPEAKAAVMKANCFGLCQNGGPSKTAHVMVLPEKTIYRVSCDEDLKAILEQDVIGQKVIEHLKVKDAPFSSQFFEMYGDVAFFNSQSRIALRNSGIIDPESLDDYMTAGGFAGLAKVLEKGEPQWIVDEMLASKLRGRGGGGYPTGLKWGNAINRESDEKFIICNADEGDPGAFMDRSMLEGDPFSVIEGMTIGAYAIGASKGYFYVRAEYPLAIERLEKAMKTARENGLLGKNIMNSGFEFDLEIRLGAGAFVCGEETALIHSIQGMRGEPRIRPPYPVESGLWGKPTVINNVETFANVPAIISYGAKWFASMGTEKSGGTKVFALAGKVNHTGLVEAPMGTTLRQIVFDIGGGVPNGKKLKAIQTGGPAGGCLSEKWLDTPVDFDTLAKAGSIMGSGGMIVMDEDDCMVDIAKFFLTFSQDESCGKCTPCREGSKRMLEILERITTGKGELEDLDKLQRLATLMNKTSLCGLGRAAANPVLSTLKEFREEYLAHVTDKRCPSRKCKALLRFEVIADKCVGCTACARNCPVNCISGKPKSVHEIDQAECIRCGRCYEVCRFDAISRS